MSKAYVLLSGGIDSSACLAEAIRECGSATALIVDYGQRHAKETEHALAIAQHLNAPVRLISAQGVIGIGGLTDEHLEMPNASYADLPEGVSPTYVPFRNGLFLSIAASIASADPEALAVYYGAHAEDAENDAYPDCSVQFIEAMRVAIEIGTYGQITLIAPWKEMTKTEVVTVGTAARIPWELTWSCYEGNEIHCGTCPTCRARREAFELAEVEDPTIYADDLEAGKYE